MSVLLVAGCANSSSVPVEEPAQEEEVVETISEPTPDPEQERQERIYNVLHGDTITGLTRNIANGGTAEDYIQRADAYLELAKAEDYYDAYEFAHMDYVMAFALDGDLSDHKENIAEMYEGLAAHELENDDIEDYEGYLARANNLVPTAERYERIVEAKAVMRKEDSNKEDRTDWHDDIGNVIYYSISEYDENGFRIKTSTYDLNDNLIDSYEGYEYDEYGNTLVTASFSGSTLKFNEEQRNTYTDTGMQIDVRIYRLGTDHQLGSMVIDYDGLGRFSGYRLIDAVTGDLAYQVVYRYNEKDEFWAEDDYDYQGNLLYHEEYTEDEDADSE